MRSGTKGRSQEDGAAPPCQSCGDSEPLAGMAFCAACLMWPAGNAGFSAGGRLPPGSSVRSYLLEACIGEGGFAEVYSARAPEGATVAVKLLKPGMDSPQFAGRFRAEQRALKGLNHPGIVRIMDAGCSEDGRSFFVMEQVDGLAITEFCEVEGLPLKRRAELFVLVCDAVNHAHQKGVIHRDLKPSNILVADGQGPKVIDFGIAKAMEDDGATGNTLVTRLGQVMGTPAYMSPEQAAGGDDADIRSDVYALGSVFYEILTGGPPHDPQEFTRLPPGSWAAFLRETDPGPPSSRLKKKPHPMVNVQDLRGDLDLIVAKALAREPERRYASVQAFAEDVRRWLSGGVVTARPPALLYQLQRMMGRHRVAAAFVFSAAAAVLTAAIMGFAIARQSRNAEKAMTGERDRALRAEQDAQAARNRAEHEGYQTAIHLARIHLDNGEPYLAEERLSATKPSLRAWEWGYLKASTPQPEGAVDSGLPAASLLASSPDGHFAAVADSAEARLLDMKSGTIMCRIPSPGAIEELAVSPDGEMLATLAKAHHGEPAILRVHRRSGGLAWELPFNSDNGLDIAWERPSGAALLVVNGNGSTPTAGQLTRFDRDSGKVLAERVILRHKVAGRGITPGQSGKMAVINTSFCSFELVRLPGLERIGTCYAQGQSLISDVLLDDGKEVARFAVGADIYGFSVGEDECRQLGSLVDGDVVKDSDGQRIRHLNTSADGGWLAISDTAELIEGGKPRHRPRVREIAVVPLTGQRRTALLPAGRVEIRPEILPPPAAQLPFQTADDTSEGRIAVFSPDSRTLVAQSWQRVVLIVAHLNEGTAFSFPLPQETSAEEWSLLPVWHPDGSVILGGKSGPFQVTPRADGITRSALPLPAGTWCAAAVGDGSTVAFGTRQGISLLDWRTKTVTREIPVPGGSWHVFADTDGVTLYSLGSSGVLQRLGPLPLGTPLVPARDIRPMANVAFHAGRRLLAMAVDKTVDIYRLSPDAAPRLVHHLAMDSYVTALAFDPRADRLAVATKGRILTVWDWPESLPLLEFSLRAVATSIAYSPDGRWLANTDFSPTVVMRQALPWKR